MCAHSGHSLVPMDKHGLSDPYCVIYENSKQVAEDITASPGPGSEEVEWWEGEGRSKIFCSWRLHQHPNFYPLYVFWTEMS